MSTSLALAAFGELPFSSAVVAVNSLDEVPSFFPRIQLYGKGAAVDQGQIKPGHYGEPQDDAVLDLGQQIDIIPLAVLDKALDVSDRDNIVTVFGKDNPDYQEIVSKSSVQDSGCMYGPVFLVIERSTGRFFEFFANNKSARRECSKLINYLPVNKAAAKQLNIEPRPPQAASLGSKYIKKPRFSWFAPTVGPSSAKFDNLPSTEVIIKAVTAFLEQAVEKPDTEDAR